MALSCPFTASVSTAMEAPEAKRAPATPASRGSQRRKGLFVPANELAGLSRAFLKLHFLHFKWWCHILFFFCFFFFLGGVGGGPVFRFLCSVFVCCLETCFPYPTNLLQGCWKSLCCSWQFVSHTVQTRLSCEACALILICVGVVRQLRRSFPGNCRGSAVPQQSRCHHVEMAEMWHRKMSHWMNEK